MRTQLSLVAISLGGSFLLMSFAKATRVTSVDLSGKKFCWDGGGSENYYADGRYVSFS